LRQHIEHEPPVDGLLLGRRETTKAAAAMLRKPGPRKRAPTFAYVSAGMDLKSYLADTSAWVEFP
jgi:hypothetical protein